MVFHTRRRGHLLSQSNVSPFYIGKHPMEFVFSYCHLGHVLNSRLSDDDDIYKRKIDFNGKVNNLICFFQNLDSETKYKLFCSYCSSFYGSVLWSLNNDQINDIIIAWRKAVRRIWNLRNTTHCSLLPLICQSLPLKDEFCRRSMNFMSKCLSHESYLIKSVAVHAMLFARASTVLGQNLLYCCNHYNCTSTDISSGLGDSIANHFFWNVTDTFDFRSAEFVRELILVRDGLLNINGILSRDEIQDIIDDICLA